LAFALTGAAAQASPESVTTEEAQRQVAVTIYNSDLALVKDMRHVGLSEGSSSLAWRDVSARIRPETALLRDVSDPKNVAVIEQNFDFDLLTPQTLLQKYVGQKVRVLTTNPATGVQTSEEATVLAAQDGVVLRYADRIESNPTGRIAFQAVPDNLRDRPTLVLDLRAARSGAEDLELSYLTSGLSWRADYVAELSDSNETLDLNAWVTLSNQSGAAYRNARLQLVAGDVNRVRDTLQMQQGMLARAAEPLPALKKAVEENLLDYHLYTLANPTTLAQNQTKQVALLEAQRIPVTTEYLLQGADYYYRASVPDIGRKLKVGVLAHFQNVAPSLGVPLPKGIIRVYKKDAAGHAQFVGEDQIDHTPNKQPVDLKLGYAFDVTASKRQSEFHKSPGAGPYQFVYEAAYEIEIHNAKSSAVTVHVQEPIPGDWEIVSESKPHRVEAANVSGWNVAVAPGGMETLQYRIKVRL
jgi:hypothetical protein